MRRYLHGGVNITGFQLIDLDSKVLASFVKEWNNDIDHSSLPEVRNALTDTSLTVRSINETTKLTLLCLVDFLSLSIMSEFPIKNVYGIPFFFLFLFCFTIGNNSCKH